MTSDFSLAYCKSLKFKDAVQYIEEFFIPLDDGNHAFKNGDKWELRSEDVIRRVFFNRLSASLNEYYFKEYDRVLKVVNDCTKPLFFDNCINFDYKHIKLPLEYQFIVDDFINNKIGLNHKPKDLYELFQKYNTNNIELNKNDFISSLTKAGINRMKSGTTFYKISYEDLFEIGLKNEWYFKDVRDIEIEYLKKQIDGLKDEVDKLNEHILEITTEDNEEEDGDEEEDYEQEEDYEEDDDDSVVGDSIIEEILF